MKALKEKRVSLRSYLRRGLVILSLLALALAFASCGESEEGGPAPTDPTDPTNPVTPPAGPTVVAVSILQQPTRDSFQGCPPDLTGLTISVLYETDGVLGTKAETYTGPSAIAAAGFYPVPNYCDIAGPNSGINPSTPVKPFSLAWKEGDSKCNTFEVEGVIPLLKVDPNPSTAVVEVFADKEPIYKGVTLTGTYKYDNASATTRYPTTADATVPTATSKEETKTIPITWGYPVFDYGSDAIQGANPAVKATIGYGSANPATISIPVIYYQVTQITFDGWADNTTFLYDDQVNYSESSGTTFRASNMLPAKVAKANFTVTYATKDDKVTTDKINGTDFLNRVKFAAENKGVSTGSIASSSWADVYAFVFRYTAGLGVSDDGVNTPILFLNDEGNFDFTMEYVPQEWLLGAPDPMLSAYTARADVSIPVATFTGDLTITRRVPGTPEFAFQKSETAMSQKELDSINRYWKLSANYELAGVSGGLTSAVNNGAFLSDYFYAGNAGIKSGYANDKIWTGDATRGDLSGEIFKNGGEYSARWADGTSSFTAYDRGYNLPLVYRGATDDESILIDVRFNTKEQEAAGLTRP